MLDTINNRRRKSYGSFASPDSDVQSEFGNVAHNMTFAENEEEKGGNEFAMLSFRKRSSSIREFVHRGRKLSKNLKYPAK